MKKLLAGVVLGTLVIGGFFFSDGSIDTAREVEPPIIIIHSSAEVM